MAQFDPLSVNFFITSAAEINAFKTAGFSFFGVYNLLHCVASIRFYNQGIAGHQLLHFIFF